MISTLDTRQVLAPYRSGPLCCPACLAADIPLFKATKTSFLLIKYARGLACVRYFDNGHASFSVVMCHVDSLPDPPQAHATAPCLSIYAHIDLYRVKSTIGCFCQQPPNGSYTT